MAASPVLLVLIAIASVQVGSSLAKDLYSSAAPLSVVWLRLISAALMLGAFTRPRLRGRPASDWGWVAAYGLCLVGMNVSFYLAIERIGIGLAVTLEFLGPLAVSVAHSRRARDLVWVGLAAVGVVVLGFGPSTHDLVGIGLALLAASLWAGYILLAGPTGRRWAGVTGLTVGLWVGVLALTPVVLALGALPPLDARVWLIGILIGFASSVVPYGLEMVALRRIQPRVFGILMSLEPAAAALFAFLLLGETVGVAEIVAMGCVVAASIGVVRTGESREAGPDPSV